MKDKSRPGDNTLAYYSLPVANDSPFAHYLHIRQHLPKTDGLEENDALPSNRTLFVAGLPYGQGEKQLAQICSAFGEVDAVHLSNVSSARVAHVVFEAPEGLKQIILSAKQGALVEVPVDIQAPRKKNSTGVRKWLTKHKSVRPDSQQLRQQLDDYVTQYEEEEKLKKEAEEAAAAAEANDGWTVVVSKKGRQKTTGGGIAVGAVAHAKTGTIAAKAEEKKSSRVSDDFYRFQRREANRNELLALREKFEEDKAKVAKLKASRKFRPY
ncbi:hypothetical protein CYMTET_40592 [Cymbomonas tetramitiformis]|uniref:RRM domain-containing protein n=1 Tax=Cymbomonas tetramitiformis TaxID=36881 RepID=A0AAE0C921_9CHLO|nr:hypothetical protein CYMTET_40592 [Cymbomonas tetramitiformis]